MSNIENNIENNDRNIFVNYYELQEIFSRFYGVPSNEIAFSNTKTSDILTFSDILQKLKNVSYLKDTVTIINMGCDFEDGK